MPLYTVHRTRLQWNIQSILMAEKIGRVVSDMLLFTPDSLICAPEEHDPMLGLYPDHLENVMLSVIYITLNQFIKLF